MQSQQPPTSTGMMPETNSGIAGGDAGRRQYRPLPIEQALRYSPMTNTPAFGLNVGYLSTSSEFMPEAYDRHLAGDIIDRLDEEAQKSVSGVSENLGKTVRYLQSLLDSEGLTQL
ncbi:Sister chromatid cohesion protein 2 [Ascosphaera atra]|nr:Sister chromatid cohesion protein 2 [Ascosphaera atra]